MNKRTYTGTSIARYDIQGLDKLTADWDSSKMTVLDLTVIFEIMIEVMKDIESMKEDKGIVSTIECDRKLMAEMGVEGVAVGKVVASIKAGFDIYRSNILARLVKLVLELNVVPTESNRDVVMFLEGLKRVNASVPEEML